MTAQGESHLDFYRRWHLLARPYFDWQFEQFADRVGRRVADVGCGPGNLTHRLLDRELYLGVDRDPAMLAELRASYADRGAVETLSADVTDPALSQALRERAIDTVLCLNLIEHVEDDAAALSVLCDGLPSGGALLLLVPALPAIYGTLDALDGHYRRYTRATLGARLAEQPLDVERLYYFNAVGALAWWLKGRVLREQAHADSNYTMMNRLIPLLRPVERTCHPPLGLSLIAIARKR